MAAQKKRSRLFVPFVISIIGIVLIVSLAEFMNPPRGPARSATNGSANASDEVGAVFASHLDSLQAMNFSAIQGQYAQNATAEFYSAGEGEYVAGSNATDHISVNATGPHQIETLFSGVLLADFADPSITTDNYTVSLAGNVATVNSTLDVEGTNLNGAGVEATVNLHVTYLGSGGSWLISYELWNFTQFASQG